MSNEAFEDDGLGVVARALAQEKELSEMLAKVVYVQDEVSTLINSLVKLASEGRQDAAIDVVFNAIDGAICARRPDAKDFIASFLRSLAAVDGVPLAAYLSAMTITRPYQDHFVPELTAIATKAREMALSIGGEEKVRKLSGMFFPFKEPCALLQDFWSSLGIWPNETLQ